MRSAQSFDDMSLVFFAPGFFLPPHSFGGAALTAADKLLRKSVLLFSPPCRFERVQARLTIGTGWEPTARIEIRAAVQL